MCSHKYIGLPLLSLLALLPGGTQALADTPHKTGLYPDKQGT